MSNKFLVLVPNITNPDFWLSRCYTLTPKIVVILKKLKKWIFVEIKDDQVNTRKNNVWKRNNSYDIQGKKNYDKYKVNSI
jgi:hypothetical protein